MIADAKATMAMVGHLQRNPKKEIQKATVHGNESGSTGNYGPTTLICIVIFVVLFSMAKRAIVIVSLLMSSD
jgi:hypothetical protein